jgi:hypothetical protein
VLLVPGPQEEVDIVRRIFDLCTIHRWTTSEIARDLNYSLIKTRMQKEWTSEDVRRLIMNPKYMGTYIWARRSSKLHTPSIQNDPDKWVVSEGAIDAAVSKSQFATAQIRIKSQRLKYTDRQLLDSLQRLWKKEGTLSIKVIARAKHCPSTTPFRRRFGRVANAFAQVGFRQNRDYSRISEEKQRRRVLERGLRRSVVEQLQGMGSEVSQDARSGVLKLNGHFGVAVKVMHYGHWDGVRKQLGWNVRINFREDVQVLIVACLDSTNEHIQAQYIIPKLARLEGVYRVEEGRNRVFLDACRSDTLQPLLNCVALTSLSSVEIP